MVLYNTHLHCSCAAYSQRKVCGRHVRRLMIMEVVIEKSLPAIQYYRSGCRRMRTAKGLIHVYVLHGRWHNSESKLMMLPQIITSVAAYFTSRYNEIV